LKPKKEGLELIKFKFTANRSVELIGLIIPDSMAASRRACVGNCVINHPGHPQKTKFRGL
jgi:hypothetical protein